MMLAQACPSNVLYNTFTWAYVNFKCCSIFFFKESSLETALYRVYEGSVSWVAP